MSGESSRVAAMAWAEHRSSGYTPASHTPSMLAIDAQHAIVRHAAAQVRHRRVDLTCRPFKVYCEDGDSHSAIHCDGRVAAVARSAGRGKNC